MPKNKLYKSIIFAFVSLVLLSSNTLNAQFGQSNAAEENYLSFEVEAVPLGENVFELQIKALIAENWHLPSQREIPEGENGPIPTEFTFVFEGDAYEIIGKTTEPKGIEKFDKIFQTDLKYFIDEAAFTQKIKVNNADEEFLLDILFMICDEERCLPPDVEAFQLKFDLEKQMLQVSGQVIELDEVDQKLTNSLKIDLKEDRFTLAEKESEEKDSNATIFLLGFIGGFIALLTPCVFPMIPLTVSFFTKGAKTKKIGLINASMYAFFIVAIYLILSIPFHLLDSVNPEILNNISTNTYLNIFFFLIFMIFAFSFFGYFEITLPQSWSNRLDQKANSVGGLIGVFFMALTLALVSFSCTGPILGSLLGGSLSGDGGATQLSFGMGGFGLALALPFGLFALFPNWLNSLPKSGGWMTSLKVVLGFLELGLAFKFLSNADMVEHWGFLKREIFIGIWIVIAIAMTLYLFGKIRFPHDPPKPIIKPARKFLGVLTLVFAIYLIPGLTNTSYANLKVLSGFPPPMFYSIYDKETDGPLGLKAYKDFDEGIAVAKSENKPVLVDFTGWACVNCRKMEEQVWSDPRVYKMIKEEYILISLYVDDRKELPKEQQFNYERPKGGVKQIKTIGDKWATFQTVNFQNNSQPFYVLMDADFQMLNKTAAYMPDVEEYYAWLKQGLSEFKGVE